MQIVLLIHSGVGVGRVTVDDHRRTPVLPRPRVAHRQAVLVGLAGGLAVEREGADPARRPSLVLLLEPGVRDDQPPVVEHVVADQPVDEGRHLRDERRVLRLQLGDGLRQAVGQRDVAPAQPAQQLLLVVAGHADARCPPPTIPITRRSTPGESGPRSTRSPTKTAVRPSGCRAPTGRPSVVALQLPAEPQQQRLQLGPAAVDVADDVERPVQLPPVVVEPLVPDRGGVDLLCAVQDVHLAEALPGQLPVRPAQVPLHAGQHPAVECAVRPGLGPLPGQRLRHVQHDRHRQYVVLARHLHQGGAGVRLQVGGVHDRQPARAQPLARDVVQHVEGLRRRGLVVLVVGDHRPERVGGEHLRGGEVLAGERRLAGAGDADQDHQRQFGDVESLHADSLTKVAIWVGEPTSGSSSPMPAISTR